MHYYLLPYNYNSRAHLLGSVQGDRKEICYFLEFVLLSISKYSEVCSFDISSCSIQSHSYCHSSEMCHCRCTGMWFVHHWMSDLYSSFYSKANIHGFVIVWGPCQNKTWSHFENGHDVRTRLEKRVFQLRLIVVVCVFSCDLTAAHTFQSCPT